MPAGEPLPRSLANPVGTRDDGDQDDNLDEASKASSELRAVWRASNARSASSVFEDDTDCYMLKSARRG